MNMHPTVLNVFAAEEERCGTEAGPNGFLIALINDLLSSSTRFYIFRPPLPSLSP